MAEGLLKKAYGRIVILEPLSPDATPKKRARYKDKVTKYHRLIGQMHLHTMALVTASGLDQDDGYNQWDECDIPVPKAEVTPTGRMQEIRDIILEDVVAVDAEVWAEMVLNPRRMALYPAEQDGFVRLVRGYRAAQSAEELVGSSFFFFFLNTVIEKHDSWGTLIMFAMTATTTLYVRKALHLN
ncbi:hypothetical protein GALMADRAFT_617580 [Galerina marginata CBS 339.88]|uniref:Uncharacterized protein n=1 Tax=Galerina marginata (strain CBS 339.88) TaxID=685588 RepID=A0A067SRI2_GALM3|nr:hypothetical protein GALMADRAFT_617580 [Galerina marginata CBS 339.88]